MTSIEIEPTVRIDGDRDPSLAIVDALAQEEDVDPVDLDPLYDAIDPDALDAVCTSGAGFDSIAFTYGDHGVTVTAVDDGFEIAIDRGSAIGDESSIGAGTGTLR